MEINREEVSELLKFASNNGIAVPDDVSEVLSNYLGFNPDSESGLSGKNTKQDLKESNQPSSYQTTNISNVLGAYSQLNQLTKPITGESLLASRSVKSKTRGLIFYTLFFFILAIGNEIIALIAEDGDIAPNSYFYFLSNLQSYFLDTLAPLFWGGLGSSVYLLKRTSDAAREYTFHPDKFGGWGTRITLGAVLGGVIQYVYDPSFLTTTGIDDNALAFLVGLSVKVVYGALEKTVELLAEKMNLDNLQSSKSEKESLRELLIKEAADENTNEERRRKIIDLLNNSKLPTSGKNENLIAGK